jgi:rhamnogalacturonyl hydrolase YesR
MGKHRYDSVVRDTRRRLWAVVVPAGLGIITLYAAIVAWPRLAVPAITVILAGTAYCLVELHSWWLQKNGVRLLAGAVIFLSVGCTAASTDLVAAIPQKAVTISTASPDYTAKDKAAIAVLMEAYHQSGPSAGRWGTSWWTTATTMLSVVEYESTTGDRSYLSDIANTWTADRRYLNQDELLHAPDFANHYADDSGWWELVWIHAYQLTGNPRYLETAEQLNGFLSGFWDSYCGGGLRWGMTVISRGYEKNSITNSIYFEANAELYEITHQVEYRDRAQQTWQWIVTSGLIRSDGVLVDHLDSRCQPTGPVWSYNQGPALDGLVALTRATHDARYLSEAQTLADGSTDNVRLNPGGVLRDVCQPANCTEDADAFPGRYVGPLGMLNAALPHHPYADYITHQVDSMVRFDQLRGSIYGACWDGSNLTPSVTHQASAVALLTAALP